MDGFIPDSQFVPDDAQGAPIGAKPQVSTPSFIPDKDFKSDEETYGTFPQQATAAAEAAAEGIAGPLAPLAETKLLGISPEDIKGRAETNPTLHTLSEIAGFGAGALTGTGEAALLGHVGEAAAKLTTQAITKGAAKSALEYTGSRIAAGAARMGSEMALLQAGDEASRAILEDPNQSVGSAAADIGLAALMGAGTGGAFSGIGLGIKAGLNGSGLQEFKNRLGVRASGVNPAEAMMKETSDAYESYHAMGSEVSGAEGLKAQALEKIMPKEITPAIDRQLQAVSDAGNKTFVSMVEKGVPERLIRDFNSEFQKYQAVVTDPAATIGQYFDALNNFKNELQLYSKGRWGLNAVQRTAEDYHFVNLTKDLSHSIKTGLEESKTWGEVADLQKKLNSAWHEAIPAVKDMEKKFMSKVGNELVLDQAKFNTYMNQSGKATSQTIKQQMMGKFVDAIEKFKNATDLAYEKAGVPNPRVGQDIAMGELKNSLEKTSVAHKLADVFYDKFGAHSLAQGAGAAVGGGLGSATGLPGGTIAGVYLGKELLGPAFTSIFKPVMEMAANSSALKRAMSFGKAIISGDQQLKKSAESVIMNGGKAIPPNIIPNEKDIKNLRSQVDDYSKNPEKLVNTNGDLSHYMPAHSMAVSSATARAVQYLAAQKPHNPKMSPLDSELPPSKAQEAAYERSLTIAQQPLMVLQHISDGTILPQDVNTVKAIYPEFYNKIVGSLMHSIAEQQSKGEIIPYRIRQSVSQFIGQPLDSTMTPMSIQSAQTVFAMNQQQQQQQGPQPQGMSAAKTKNMKSLSSNALTADQARDQRQRKV